MMRTMQLVMVGVIMTAIGCERSDVLDETQQHLNTTTTVAPTSGFGDPTTVAAVDSSGNENWVGGNWYVPLPVSAGDVVGTVQAIVRDNGSTNGHPADGNNVIAVLQSRVAGSTSPLASASSDGSGNRQTLNITTTHTVASGEQLVMEYIGLTGGALPGPSTVPSMTGPVTVSPRQRHVTRRISSASVQPGNSGTPGAVLSGGAWHFVPSGANIPLYFPLPVNTGDAINGWSIWVQKNSASSTSLVASLLEQDSTTGTQRVLGFTNSLQAPNPTISATDISFPIQAAKSYILSIYNTSGSTFDAFTDAEVQIVPQD